MINNKHIGEIIGEKDGITVIDCASCKFKHIYPFPTVDTLTSLYKDDFYSTDKANYFKNAEDDADWWKLTYDNYYSLLEKHASGRRILDVGSGPGDFLKCGKDRGWDVIGIEPSLEACKYSRKKKVVVVNDFFSYEIMRQYGPFDVVHVALVLEHVPDPVNFINDMKRLLKPNGLLAIYCPNDYNYLQKIVQTSLKIGPWWVAPKHHLNYFNSVSMKDLLKRLGFNTLELLGTFPMEFFLLSGLNYVSNDKLGRKCHKMRKIFEMNIYKKNTKLLNEMYSQLIEHNIGRSFFIIVKKK